MSSTYRHLEYVAKGRWDGTTKSGRKVRVMRVSIFAWDAVSVDGGRCTKPLAFVGTSLAEIDRQLEAL